MDTSRDEFGSEGANILRTFALLNRFRDRHNVFPVGVTSRYQEGFIGWQAFVKELRTNNRYQLAAQMFFSLSHSEDRLLQLTGVTRDISMGGVSFLTTAKVESGAYIKLDVYLPSLRGQARGMILHAEGTVVRVETKGFETKVSAEVLFEREPEATVLAANVIQ